MKILAFTSSLALVLGFGLAQTQQPKPGKTKPAEVKASEVKVCAAAQDPKTPAIAKFGVILPGRAGWLFNQSELHHSRFAFEGRTGYFKRLHDALEAQGVRLAILPIPTRLSIYPEMLYRKSELASKYELERVRIAYRDSVERLRSEGITVMNLMDAALEYRKTNSPTLFFRRDHHWTPGGAKLFARTIAKALEGIDLGARATFKTVNAGSVPYGGALPYFLEQICKSKIPSESLSRFETKGPDGDQPVVLVGSDYSAPNEQDFHFAEFLSEALGAGVQNLALPNGGFIGSLESFMLGGAFTAGKPRLIVWEFPVSSAPYDQPALRQIIPTINTTCSNDDIAFVGQPVNLSARNPATKLRDDAPIRVLEAPTGAGFQGNNFVLGLDFTDRKNLNFEVNLTYSDKKETISVRRSTWNGKFLLELNEDFGELQTVSVSTKKGLLGSVLARVCRVQ
jgi:SGNH hydrolase-like domain, acetyltransferase AlgX